MGGGGQGGIVHPLSQKAPLRAGSMGEPMGRHCKAVKHAGWARAKAQTRTERGGYSSHEDPIIRRGRILCLKRRVTVKDYAWGVALRWGSDDPGRGRVRGGGGKRC